MTDPRPVPQPNGLYAHEITGPDGRLIEAYTPQPLDPAEIDALLAQSYADRPDRNELARMIMEMEGPELPSAPAPAHVAPPATPEREQFPEEPSGADTGGGDPWSPLRRVVQMRGMGVDGLPGPDEDMSYGQEMASPADQQMVKEAARAVPLERLGAPDDLTTYEPQLPGFRVEKDPPTADELAASMLQSNGQNWWQQDLGDDIPAEFRDLIEPIGQP